MIDSKGGADIDLKELYAKAADLELALPAALTTALRDNARATAARVRDRAQQLLIAQQKTASRKLANNIKIEDDVANELVAVVSYPAVRSSVREKGQGTNLPTWVEHGTVHMEARPYMRPAAEAERDGYTRTTEAAIQQAIDDLE